MVKMWQLVLAVLSCGMPTGLAAKCDGDFQMGNEACGGQIERYWYYKDTGVCSMFHWTGCTATGQPIGDNDNHFESYRDCVCACVSNPSIQCTNNLDVCNDPQPTTGQTCNTFSITKWYYDGGSCQSFSWRGCNVNTRNFFNTVTECQTQCGGTTGPCSCGEWSGWECDVACGMSGTRQTRRRTCINCASSSEIQQKLGSCTRLCGKCALPKDRGPCFGSIQKWYYNSSTKQCSTFNYGGCSGNANNFDTWLTCSTECIQSSQGKCDQPRHSGSAGCNNFVEMWYYNSVTKQCTSFTYRGCGGNDNRFSSSDVCRAECIQAGQGVCAVDINVGQCTVTPIRYYYHSGAKKCNMVEACAGTGNNFGSRSLCEAQCMSASSCQCGQWTAWFCSSSTCGNVGEQIRTRECPNLQTNCPTQVETETGATCNPSCSGLCTGGPTYGVCDASTITTRYYYSASNQCVMMSACVVAGNNYASSAACLTRCTNQGTGCQTCTQQCGAGMVRPLDSNGCERCTSSCVACGSCNSNRCQQGTYMRTHRPGCCYCEICPSRVCPSSCGLRGTRKTRDSDGCVTSCTCCPVSMCLSTCPTEFRFMMRESDGCYRCECRQFCPSDPNEDCPNCEGTRRYYLDSNQCRRCRCMNFGTTCENFRCSITGYACRRIRLCNFINGPQKVCRMEPRCMRIQP